ncbi:hypothetical protein niasHS_007289 [Heterodera schachtii]|uniref:Uncharacterized protein n=1 Tax=Heterodera schachtii TaxID=97005 RepID=A0ABD2JJX7_HETSC
MGKCYFGCKCFAIAQFVVHLATAKPWELLAKAKPRTEKELQKEFEQNKSGQFDEGMRRTEGHGMNVQLISSSSLIR